MTKRKTLQEKIESNDWYDGPTLSKKQIEACKIESDRRRAEYIQGQIALRTRNKDHELLTRLYEFLHVRTFITADVESVVDMTQRYKNPPMTRLNRAAMQMTMKEYNRLMELLKEIKEHLEQPEHA